MGNKKLSTENERHLQQATSELIKNKTVLIFARFMRTVVSADKIVALKEGQVMETGTSAIKVT